MEILTQEYEFHNKEYQKIQKSFKESLNLMKNIKSINQSLKDYSKIEFLIWFTSKYNPVQKMLESIINLDFKVKESNLIFDKEKEIESLKNLIFK